MFGNIKYNMYNKYKTLKVMGIKKHITKMKKNYWAPTPKKWRKLGDSLLAVSAMGVPAVLMNHHWVGISLFIIGIIGKFLTNFFTDNI
jgi:hypothetical protein